MSHHHRKPPHSKDLLSQADRSRRFVAEKGFWHKNDRGDQYDKASVDAFTEAVNDADFTRALQVLQELSRSEVAALKTDRALLERIPQAFDLLDAVALLDVFGRGTVDPLVAYGGLQRGEEREQIEEIEDEEMEDSETQSREFDDSELRMSSVNPLLLADELAAQRVPVMDQLELTGLLAGDPDWEMLFGMLCDFSTKDRRIALVEIRAQGQWEELLAQMDEGSISMVQEWLDEDLEATPRFSIDVRIEDAPNAARASEARARIDALVKKEKKNKDRVKGRVRELLLLGVAHPPLRSPYALRRGILGVVQAERAARSLLGLPPLLFLRFLLLLETTGPLSRLNQSVLLLKGLAARLEEIADEAEASMDDIEQFANDIRGLDEESLIRATSVLQVAPAGEPGLQQRFLHSCNVTAALAIRSEADPMEAVRIGQEAQLHADHLDGHLAGEAEEALSNHGGNVAVARDPSRVLIPLIQAMHDLMGEVPTSDLLAVRDHLAGKAFDKLGYKAGITRIRALIDQNGFPNDQAVRLAREVDSGTHRPGLTPHELVEEMNGMLGLATQRNQEVALTWDDTLWQWFTHESVEGRAVDHALPQPVSIDWTSRIRALLDKAASFLDLGLDTAVAVYWEGGGARGFSFHDVSGVCPERQFFVHDTTTGNTSWVQEEQILQGNWPGFSRRGLLCAVIG